LQSHLEVANPEGMWMAQYQQIDRELRQFLDHIRHGTPPPVPPQVARLLNYVHEHLFDPELNVKVVKAQCRFYDNNVTLRFRSAVGTGMREYIERLRLEAAQHLLGSRSYPVYVVAMAVGYSYPETFCRAFQRLFGRHPSATASGRRQTIKRKDQEGSSRPGPGPESTFRPSEEVERRSLPKGVR
jgi:AraC-like DNA-binding protein